LKLKERFRTSSFSGVRGKAVQTTSKSLVSWCQIAEKREGKRRLFRASAKAVGSSGISSDTDASPQGLSMTACFAPSLSIGIRFISTKDWPPKTQKKWRSVRRWYDLFWAYFASHNHTGSFH
jgi:hypothetical protein